MLTDIEIAQSCVMQPIEKIADTLDLTPDLLEPYGRYKAKVDYLALKNRPQKGRLVLVTAINPTPAGEGKTDWPTLCGWRDTTRALRFANRLSARFSV